MKKKYKEVEILISAIQAADVICTSGPTDTSALDDDSWTKNY